MHRFSSTLAFAAALLAGVPCSSEAGAISAYAATPTISADYVRSYCDGQQAFAIVNIHVNAADVGLPGLVYVAESDPNESQANYALLGSAAWYPFQGEAMFVPYAIVNSLQDAALTMPAGERGWKLWVGYGALTAKANNALTAASLAQAKAAQIGRTLPPIDPDHIRRSFVQEDMRQNGKYVSVLTWDATTAPTCTTGY